MTEHVTIDETIEGKKVINARGEQIGVVSGVRGGTPYVDPDPGITDRIMSILGWDDIDEEDYPLPDDSIDRITGDEVHLQRSL